MRAEKTIVKPDGEVIFFKFNYGHHTLCENHFVRGVVSTCGGSTRCGKGTRFLSVFLSSGKGFTKLKLAERALSISEQIIPSRPVLGLFPDGHPQSAYHTKFFCLNI